MLSIGELTHGTLLADKRLSLRLDSWKEIAHHFQRSTRTVQRWRRVYGLPVYQLAGPDSSVFAYSDELDTWLHSRKAANLSDEPVESLHDNALIAHTPDVRIQVNPSSFLQTVSKFHKISNELTQRACEIWGVVSESNIPIMTTYLIEAVNHDPQNVTALAHLAHSYMIQSILGLIEPHAALTASEAVVKRARRINSTHIEVRNASAWLDLLYARDWQHADREFGEILQSESCNWRALAGKALTAFACNRCEEAIPLLERISAENILSSTAYFLHAYVLYASGYISDALSVVYTAKSLGLGIYWHKTIEALCLIQAGDLEQVINQFSADFLNSESTDILRGAIGYAYTASGRQEEVLHEINKFMSPEFTHQPRHDFFAPALIYLGLGKMQKTVECLEQSYRAGSFFSLGFHTLPILQQLRNTPEYMNLSSILLYPSRS